jgi:Rod binding domain-containing protein
MGSLSITPSKTNAQDFDRAESTLAVRNLRTDAQSKEKAKIEKSARDFESILIGQWLEQAEKSFATVPGDDPDKKDQDVGQDQMRSIAFHSLAEGLTKAGGIGLASMISKHLEAAEVKQNDQNEKQPRLPKLNGIK